MILLGYHTHTSELVSARAPAVLLVSHERIAFRLEFVHELVGASNIAVAR